MIDLNLGAVLFLLFLICKMISHHLVFLRSQN